MTEKMLTNPPRRAWVAPIALASLLALAGCGGTAAAPTATSSSATSPPTSAASATPQTAALGACGLITEQEATTALSSDPGAGTPEGTGANQACAFGQGNGGGFLQAGYNDNQTRALLDGAKAKVSGSYQQQGGTVVEVAGIGDANFVASSPHGGGCYVLKGSILGHITLISPSVLSSPADTMTTLCRAMEGRI